MSANGRFHRHLGHSLPATLGIGLLVLIFCARQGRTAVGLQPGLDGQVTSINGKIPFDSSDYVPRASVDFSPSASKQEKVAASPAQSKTQTLTEMQIYSQARTVISLTREELLLTYFDELQDLEFDENQQELDALLQKVGENVDRSFRDLPNTISKEQVRRELLGSDGRVEESITQNYYYTAQGSMIGVWEETRTDSSGREIPPERMSRMSFLTSGFASSALYLHSKHQYACRFRYLGRQRSAPFSHVIAFAQRPEISDIFGTFKSEFVSAPARLLNQGFVWVDPGSHQILRLRQGLLAPRYDISLAAANSDIWYGEVRFQSVAEPFWLPREVIVTFQYAGRQFRNRHRYSDYEVFTIAVQEKVAPPAVKK